MSRGAVADLARFQVDRPLWTITQAGTELRAFEARRGGVLVKAATLAELADRMAGKEASWPG